MTNYISFPGLGIKEFAVKEIAFSLFGRDVAWYGVIITFGIILAVCYVLNRAKYYEGVKEDDIVDLALYIIPLSIIGARLYYVLTSLDQYETFAEAIAIWEGGLAIYGAVIAGALTALVFCLLKKINVLKMYDMLVPAVMIGQLIGRWGNFVNAEAHGGVTDIFIRMGIRTENMAEPIYVHPTFLYESLWNLLGFLLINSFYKKKKYHGQIFFMYITWYGFGRFLIEGLRTDSLYVGPFRISQVIGLASFVVGGIFLLALWLRGKGDSPILETEGTVITRAEYKEAQKKEKEEKQRKDEKKKNGKNN